MALGQQPDASDRTEVGPSSMHAPNWPHALEAKGMPWATEDGVGWGRLGGLQDSSNAGTLPPIADSAAASWDAARSCPALSRRQISAPRSLHAADPALSLALLLPRAPARRLSAAHFQQP